MVLEDSSDPHNKPSSKMRWYEEFPQPKDADKQCPLCKSADCRNSPTGRERERSQVLQISRAKMLENRQYSLLVEEGVGGARSGQTACSDLRAAVAVRNTVRRLELDINREIMAAFAAPVSMG